MDKTQLQKYVLENPNLVSMKQVPEHPELSILKYKRRVFYDNLWNDYLEECRGTIVDEDFKIISYPFTKIYNFEIEDKSPVLNDDQIVAAFRKVNGYMLAATWYQNDVLLSTTGSTNSDYITMARDLLDISKFRDVCSSTLGYITYMFEVVHPEDPHIIKEEPGLYYLGSRYNNWGSDINTHNLPHLANRFGVKFPEEYLNVTVGQVKQMTHKCHHEGFVFYTVDGVSAKLKSPWYLTQKWMARNPRTDKLLTKGFKQTIDEEYYSLLDHVRENIETFTSLSEQERLEFIRHFLQQS